MTAAPRIRGLLWSALLWLTMAGTAQPMTVPEKLIFDLTWAGITTGSATLETVQGPDSVKIISTAQSARWVSVFFTVNDRVESTLEKTSSPSPGAPKRYLVRLREGRYRRDKEIVFDRAGQRASLVDRLSGETGVFPIKDAIFDPLSCFYYVRSLPMIPGRSVFVDIFDNKRVWKVEVRVLRKERIRTSLGEFDTVVIKPLMKSDGTFNRKGDMHIWLTDDRRRLPVKMQTRVAVGNITATLVGGAY